MFKKLLSGVALAAIIAGGAHAQTTAPAPAPNPADPIISEPAEQPMVKRAEGQLASNIIGEAVYNGMGEDAETIGDVNDLVLSPEGQVEAVVIGVGGFLGLGEKNVAIEFELIEVDEIDGREYLVVNTTAEALEAQQAFNRAAYEPIPADADIEETKPATADDLTTSSVRDVTPDAENPEELEEPAESEMMDEPADDEDAPAPADAENPPAEQKPTE